MATRLLARGICESFDRLCVKGSGFAIESIDYLDFSDDVGIEFFKLICRNPVFLVQIAPVCIGFGSMGVQDAEAMMDLVLQAASISEHRLVLLSGWAELKPGAQSSSVFVIREAPHQWLYQRCAAVVHHGGAGTTAAAMNAGVPAIVVPFHGDQPFWTSLVSRLGLGPPPILRKNLTAKRLAFALKSATNNDSMRARAAELGRTLGAENGARMAAESIKRHVVSVV